MESGIQCPRCGAGACARRHAWRYRKRVTDLSTGAVFEKLPILRVRFCDGSTASLVPGELWRGCLTQDSMLETVIHVLRDGVAAAYEWTWYAGTGECMVSRRSLRRWCDFTRKRLIGSALSWLGPQLGISWSSVADEAAQLETLLDKMTAPLLSAFRAVAGHAVLDKPRGPRLAPRSARRRILGRHGPAVPHTTPSSLQPRGAWSRHTRRGPPRPRLEEE